VLKIESIIWESLNRPIIDVTNGNRNGMILRFWLNSDISNFQDSLDLQNALPLHKAVDLHLVLP